MGITLKGTSWFFCVIKLEFSNKESSLYKLHKFFFKINIFLFCFEHHKHRSLLLLIIRKKGYILTVDTSKTLKFTPILWPL